MLYSQGPPLTEEQARFAATHFDIIGPGGAADGHPNAGEVTQAAAAAQLKRYNPKVVILIYRNTNLVIEGVLHSDLEFQSHPEWMLRNASGAPVYNSPGQPFINFTNPAAREWWVRGIVAAITEQPNGTAIDGVYVKFRHFFLYFGHSELGLRASRGYTQAQGAAFSCSVYRAIGVWQQESSQRSQ